MKSLSNLNLLIPQSQGNKQQPSPAMYNIVPSPNPSQARQQQYYQLSQTQKDNNQQNNKQNQQQISNKAFLIQIQPHNNQNKEPNNFSKTTPSLAQTVKQMPSNGQNSYLQNSINRMNSHFNSNKKNKYAVPQHQSHDSDGRKPSFLKNPPEIQIDLKAAQQRARSIQIEQKQINIQPKQKSNENRQEQENKQNQESQQKIQKLEDRCQQLDQMLKSTEEYSKVVFQKLLSFTSKNESLKEMLTEKEEIIAKQQKIINEMFDFIQSQEKKLLESTRIQKENLESQEAAKVGILPVSFSIENLSTIGDLQDKSNTGSQVSKSPDSKQLSGESSPYNINTKNDILKKVNDTQNLISIVNQSDRKIQKSASFNVESNSQNDKSLVVDLQQGIIELKYDDSQSQKYNGPVATTSRMASSYQPPINSSNQNQNMLTANYGQARQNNTNNLSPNMMYVPSQQHLNSAIKSQGNNNFYSEIKKENSHCHV